ncbi:PGC-1 and ERR-induced regulator in muscle protein 1 [Hypomesus transpacificus]|uniref:PGC-1 and ERR-induced regulator in muscle protein 1 n=1 Tax=Hypomesus transpacificus TaxID=137520 RepID=UPI001F078FE0|nr:PGC-1 and ERR-induced regulator in muscle protein 1 [Hypomesus transpacificus]
MDDFEYSVEISDRDWDCFFQECEECSLLSPALAGTDDSGMSDLDDLGSAQLSKALVEPNLGAAFLEDGRPSDGPPDRQGSPLPNYLSKYAVGVSENILSGSEEDVHLESVNRFFERLRSFTETGQCIEPGTTAVGKTEEAVKREEACSNGPPANLAALPANILEFNSQSAISETAAGKHTAVPDDSDCTTTGTDTGADFKMASERTHSEFQDEANKPFLDTELAIREEEWLVTTAHKPRKTRDEEDPSLDQSVCLDLPSAPGKSPQSSQTWVAKSMDDLRPGDDLVDQALLKRSPPLQEKPSVNLDVIPCDNEAEESKCVGLSCQLGASRVANQELSPAGNNKKKKRRRKRASMEPVETECSYERQVLANRSDSDEETRAFWAAEMSPLAKLSGDCCDGFMIEHIQPPQSLADDKDLSTPSYGGDNVTNLQPCSGSALQASIEFQECDGLSASCATCVGGEPASTGSLATSQTEHEPQVNNTKIKIPTNEPQQDIDRELMNVEDFTATGFISPKQDTLCVVTDSMVGLDTQGQSVGGEMQLKFTRPSLDFREIQKEAHTDLTLLSDKLLFPHRSSYHSEPDTGNSQTHYKEDTYQTVCPAHETDPMLVLPHVWKVDQQSSLKSPFSSLSAFKGNQNRVDESNITSSTVLPVSKHTDASPASSESPDTLITYCGTPPMADTSEITDRNKSQDICENDTELRAYSLVPTEDARARTGDGQVTGNTPDPNMTGYAMSSFWKDMEQMTINDILRFQGIGAVQHHVTPPDGVTAEPVEGVDSGYFGERGDSNPQLSGEVFNISSFDEDSNPITDADVGGVCPDSSGVLWESKHEPVEPGTETCSDHATLVKDLPQQIISGSPQKYYVKKMYKNRSMQNLPALESKPLGQSLKSRVLPTVITEEGEYDKELFNEEHTLRRDCRPDSLPPSSFSEQVNTKSYNFSITDIFRYFFTGSTSEPCQSDTDNMQTTAASYASGNSVAETYDHFFSDFEVDSFFYPLLEEGHNKNETVPIFSCSRTTNRNLQFPDAYDHFFPSSSSEDSSMESDEEDCESRAPIRVVSRFTLKDGEIQGASTGPDIYENFFSDWDQGGNVFWKNGLSLRNVRFPGSTYQRPTSDSLALVPVTYSNQTRKLVQRTIQPIKVLGNQAQPFLDPLLYNFSDRLVRQLAEQPLRHDDLQIAVANPRLDAPLLNVRQTDMCLVFIAFASWVLKSANPQVGDAWKAVLLANVSALSAIRYLRRHARKEEEEAGRGETLRHTPSM